MSDLPYVPIVLKLTVEMGGSTGIYEITDYPEIIRIGEHLADFLGEPPEIIEAPDALGEVTMALILLEGPTNE